MSVCTFNSVPGKITLHYFQSAVGAPLHCFTPKRFTIIIFFFFGYRFLGMQFAFSHTALPDIVVSLLCWWMLLSRLYRSCICSRAASCKLVSLYNVHYECLLVELAQCHICPSSEASRWSQSAMKKCFVIILYIKKYIFCNVCGVVLLKSSLVCVSLSCACMRVCVCVCVCVCARVRVCWSFGGKLVGVTEEWQDVLRLMSHCVAAATLFILCVTRRKFCV